MEGSSITFYMIDDNRNHSEELCTYLFRKFGESSAAKVKRGRNIHDHSEGGEKIQKVIAPRIPLEQSCECHD